MKNNEDPNPPTVPRISATKANTINNGKFSNLGLYHSSKVSTFTISKTYNMCGE